MLEIERKFLVQRDKWQPNDSGKKIKQGYLLADAERTVRVRLAGAHAFLTIKGKSVGISRTELEYEIPIADAEILFQLCVDTYIEKTRYYERHGELTWEIDVFEGQNKGLVMAEVELKSEDQPVELPEWAGEEVSGDYRYFNGWLSKHPFSSW